MVTINCYGGTLIKVLITHQHRLSLYCTRLLLSVEVEQVPYYLITLEFCRVCRLIQPDKKSTHSVLHTLTIERLCLHALAAGKNVHCSKFGFSNSWIRAACVDQLLVNLYKNPKLIFMTLSPSMYPISMGWTLNLDASYSEFDRLTIG